MSKNVVTLKSVSDSEVTQDFIESGVIRQTVYGFLLEFYSNFVPIHLTSKTVVTLKSGPKVTQSH